SRTAALLNTVFNWSLVEPSVSATFSLTPQAIGTQFADDLATSRVVISRLLKQLENDKKIILYRNEIKILPALE
ncbi:MAG TPA: hypothetical protein PKD93_00595, partial [Ferruginibacter sp.]|nr:hypothetical protein [Ferruginibacter sp.]